MPGHKNILISSLSDWNKVAGYFEECTWLGVDTEFMREKTYYPQLCLVQLSCSKTNLCLDPLAFDCSSVLSTLLANPRITKIIHSASQDIEVLGYYCGIAIENLYDTQLAAEFCGLSSQIGYAGLVTELLKINLTKTQTRSNWNKRPLTGHQIQYSIDDVLYLKPIYDELNARLLLDSPQKSWLYQEQSIELARMNKFRIDPQSAYRRLKSPRNLKPKNQNILKSLANWRESKAQLSDKPRNWILTDKTIYAIAESMPADILALNTIVKNSSRFSNIYIDDIFAHIKSSLEQPAEIIWSVQGPLSEQMKQESRTLRQQIISKAQQYNIPVSRLATRQDIETYVRSGKGRLGFGWRKEALTNY